MLQKVPHDRRPGRGVGRHLIDLVGRHRLIAGADSDRLIRRRDARRRNVRRRGIGWPSRRLRRRHPRIVGSRRCRPCLGLIDNRRLRRWRLWRLWRRRLGDDGFKVGRRLGFDQILGRRVGPGGILRDVRAGRNVAVTGCRQRIGHLGRHHRRRRRRRWCRFDRRRVGLGSGCCGIGFDRRRVACRCCRIGIRRRGVCRCSRRPVLARALVRVFAGWVHQGLPSHPVFQTEMEAVGAEDRGHAGAAPGIALRQQLDHAPYRKGGASGDRHDPRRCGRRRCHKPGQANAAGAPEIDPQIIAVRRQRNRHRLVGSQIRAVRQRQSRLAAVARRADLTMRCLGRR